MRIAPQFNSNFLRFRERKNRWSLTLVFSLIVFLVLFSAIALTSVSVYVLYYFDVIQVVEEDLGMGTIILLMSLISLVLGAALSFLFSKIPLKPINTLINKMNRLAAGDFKARLALYNHPAFHEISTSFNRMAAELESTEVLRGDFINNFSHEFKTPIVSIAGFAKLVRRGNLTEEQKQQYLASIEEESMRLSYMATNVLNLTKVENQKILAEVTKYNVSEQIRSAVLLLEGKWSKKNIDLQLDFDEYEIEANEELLKQVWINLIDNAVKFAPDGGSVVLDIADEEAELRISIGNTGEEIPPEKLERIFHKFYQADESHAAEGNGIGLAVVKRVVSLHGGKIEVARKDGMTIFDVTLPKIQW